MCCINWGLVGVWFGAIATAIYSGFAIGLYFQTRRMAITALETADRAQKNYMATQRPWIEIRSPTLKRNALNQIVLSVTLFNYGKSPTQVKPFTIAEIVERNPYSEIPLLQSYVLTLMPKSEVTREFVFDIRRANTIAVHINVKYSAFGSAFTSSLKFRFIQNAPEDLEATYT
jgi:hypothetical protein